MYGVCDHASTHGSGLLVLPRETLMLYHFREKVGMYSSFISLEKICIIPGNLWGQVCD